MNDHRAPCTRSQNINNCNARRKMGQEKKNQKKKKQQERSTNALAWKRVQKFAGPVCAGILPAQPMPRQETQDDCNHSCGRYDMMILGGRDDEPLPVQGWGEVQHQRQHRGEAWWQHLFPFKAIICTREWWLVVMPGGCINNMLELRTSTLKKGQKTKKPALSSGTKNQNPPDKHKGCQLTREMRKKPTKEKMTRYCV